MNMNRKTIITLIIVGILAVAIPAGLYLVQQQQILKSRATVGTYSTIRTITANGAFGGWNQMTEAYRGGTLAPLINSLSPSVRIDLKNIWNAPVPASVSPSTPTLGSLVNERGRGGLVDHGSLYNSFGQLIGEFPEAAVIMGTLPGGRKNWTEYINLSALLDKVDTVTGTPTGTITASSCTTGVGGGTAAHCGTTVNWSTTGVSDASTINVRYDRSNTDVCNATVVWNNPTGPQSANFIDTTGYYFHLCTGTTHLAKVSVKAQGSTGTPTGRISASAVTIPAGQTNGVTRITVDQMQNFGSNALICVVSDAPNASLVTFAAPGSSGSWSGNTAASYEGTTGAWIAPGRRYTFNLYSWNSGTANHSDCTGTPVSSVVVDGPGGDTPTQTFPQSFRVANSEKELFSAPEYAFTGNPTTIDWILDSGAGVKIVYAQFRLEEVWGGMVKSSIELIGPPPPFEVILSANPTTVTSGQQTTLSWTIMGAVTSCDLSLGVSEDVSARGGQQSPIVTSGSKTITLTNSTSRPLTQTFTLGCSDGNGNGAQSSADVKVLPVLTECTVPQFVRSFNSYFGDSRYTSICDFNKDEAINLTDIYYLLNQQPHI